MSRILRAALRSCHLASRQRPDTTLPNLNFPRGSSNFLPLTLTHSAISLGGPLGPAKPCQQFPEFDALTRSKYRYCLLGEPGNTRAMARDVAATCGCHSIVEISLFQVLCIMLCTIHQGLTGSLTICGVAPGLGRDNLRYALKSVKSKEAIPFFLGCPPLKAPHPEFTRPNPWEIPGIFKACYPLFEEGAHRIVMEGDVADDWRCSASHEHCASS
jgi:hypothetical protein